MLASSRYCLYCYEALERTGSVSQRCPRCNRVHLKRDSLRFWTREPQMIVIERCVKAGVVLFIVALFLAIHATLGPTAQSTDSFFFGPLVMLGGVLWWTAGLITRKPRNFSARLLWGLVILLLVVGPPVLFMTLDLVAQREDMDFDYLKRNLAMALPGLPLIVIGIPLHFLSGRFERFKQERIASGQA